MCLLFGVCDDFKDERNELLNSLLLSLEHLLHQQPQRESIYHGEGKSVFAEGNRSAGT